MIFYRDPMQLMTHLGEKHGADAIMGMAELIAWSQGPAESAGAIRGAHARPRRSMRCTPVRQTKPNARPSIRCCSARRWTPSTATCRTKKSTRSCAGCWRFWPSTPPTAARTPPAARPAWPLRWRCPTTAAAMMTKLAGGIGALAEHLHDLFVVPWRRDPVPRPKSRQILVGERPASPEYGSATGPPSAHPWWCPTSRPISPSPTSSARSTCPADLIARLTGRDHRAAFVQMHFALDGLPEFAPPYDFLNDPGMQHVRRHVRLTRGTATPVGDVHAAA